MKTKFLTVLLAIALATGIAIYLLNQREINHLRAENQNSMRLHEATATERDAAVSAAAAATNELERSRKDQAELLRLRGEVAQLRRLLDAQKAQARSQPIPGKPTEPTIPPPGTYITKERLAHVGYATPEAALQTITWAMMHGTYDQVREGDASPDIFASELENQKARDGFEARQKLIAPLFKGFQLVAKKLLADDKVEIKTKFDTDPIPGQQHEQPLFMIQPLQKIGDTWKFTGSTRAHQPTWDNDGQIQTFVP